MSSLVARHHDAAVTPEAWPDALTALTDAAGVASAALIIFNKSTGEVDEAHFCGLSAGFKSDYVRHYAALDRTRQCSMIAGKALRVSSGPAVAKQRMVQRFHINVRRSRYSGSAACRYIWSLHYLRYSPADRPQLLRQRRLGRKSRGHPVEAGRLAPYRASLFAEIRYIRPISNRDFGWRKPVLFPRRQRQPVSGRNGIGFFDGR